MKNKTIATWIFWSIVAMIVGILFDFDELIIGIIAWILIGWAITSAIRLNNLPDKKSR